MVLDHTSVIIWKYCIHIEIQGLEKLFKKDQEDTDSKIYGFDMRLDELEKDHQKQKEQSENKIKRT